MKVVRVAVGASSKATTIKPGNHVILAEAIEDEASIMMVVPGDYYSPKAGLRPSVIELIKAVLAIDEEGQLTTTSDSDVINGCNCDKCKDLSGDELLIKSAAELAEEGIDPKFLQYALEAMGAIVEREEKEDDSDDEQNT